MSATVPAADPNAVSIEIGDRKIVGWENVVISRSAEAFPNSFTLTASDEYSADPSRQTIVPGANGEGAAGEDVKVYIGSDLVITGFTDRVTITTAPRQHEITIQGRGICQDLVDCSADLMNSPEVRGGTITATDALDLARKLCKGFGLKARSAVADLGRPIRPFSFSLEETPFNIIERVCQYAGYLVYEDEFGTLVLDRIGTKEMASGFTMPGNVEAAQSTLSIDQRFSHYTVLWSSVNNYAEITPVASKRADLLDRTMPRNRPHIIVMSEDNEEHDLGMRRAEWELARRIGRSQAVSVTCDSWRDKNGLLWQPNWLVPLDMPAHKIVGKKWVIGSVTFRKDSSGTHADLVLMPPDAFSVKPSNLVLWDNEIGHALSPSQSPAPPNPTLGVPPT
jgi:prophage tail gpP-like protein